MYKQKSLSSPITHICFFLLLLLSVNIPARGIRIDTPKLSLQLDSVHGNIESLFDKRCSHNHIMSQSIGTLWILDFSEPIGKQIAAENASTFSWQQQESDPQTLCLTWKGFGISQCPDLSVHISITAAEAATRWGIEIKNLNDTSPPVIHFPRLPAITPQESEVLAVPYWIGEKTTQIRALLSKKHRRSWSYPGHLSMQCITLYSNGGPGLYLSTDDVHARTKSFAVFDDAHDNIGMEVCHFPNITEIKKGSYTLPYEVSIGLFEGDWVTVAKIYRHWALERHWAHNSRLKNHKTPDWVENTGFWVWNRDHSSGVLPPALQMQSYMELPVSVFWHWWHGCSYDAGFPEYLPPREGTKPFRDALCTAQSEGIHAIVYMNQRLWSMTTDSWTSKNAEQYAVKKKDGTIRPEIYNTFTKTPCASMCMGTSFWRNTYAALAEKAFTSLNVNGIYMDQACSSLVCHDTKHEHAPGGGDYWMKGFQSLESDIRTRCPDIVLAGEGTGEAWIPHLDLMLSLQVSMERYAAPGKWEPIPFFNAVYHGYTIQYGNYASLTRPPYDSLWPKEFAPEIPLQLLDEKFRYQFRMEQARSFVWGQQPCLANFTIEQLTERIEELKYLKQLALLRNHTLPYLLHGTFLGFPDMEIPMMEIAMSRLSIYAGQQDAVQEYTKSVPCIVTSIWQDSKNNIAVPIVNISDATLEIKLQLNSTEHSLPTRGIVYKIACEKRLEIMRFDQGTATILDKLNGAEACIYEFINK
ncbi:MAG: hypothetical protein KAH38_09375 [Candidatus Hydrogenedentes bacterium]|nr:hypothetical protein [Candidatus Hydrogenedentota bacterium]